ncbi:hypothetical protein ABZZ36_43125 [Actinacidiphila glaucinigra]|uniref:hypothetical protein n=1 Tax=Actinacidiphila glaucinigra TaxID=235986 RepID=UPI0033AFD74A
MTTPQYPPPSGPPTGPPNGWQRQPGWAGPPPQQPRKSNAGKIIGFGCFGVIVLVVIIVIIAVLAVLASSGGDTSPKPGASKATTDKGEKSSSDSNKAGPTGDVKIDSCEVDKALYWPSAKLTITNRSSKTSNYMISLEFVDSSGTRISEGYAASNNLGPGKVAKETVQGTSDAKGEITCRITEVQRYAS